MPVWRQEVIICELFAWLAVQYLHNLISLAKLHVFQSLPERVKKCTQPYYLRDLGRQEVLIVSARICPY